MATVTAKSIIHLFLCTLVVVSQINYSNTTTEDIQAKQAPNTKHPLSPLDSNEIQATSKFIIQQYSTKFKKIVFVTISLYEPKKKLVLDYLEKLGKSINTNKLIEHNIPRRSTTVFIDEITGKSYEIVLDLTNTIPTEFSFRMLETGEQPVLTQYDVKVTRDIISKDPQIYQRLKDLGIENDYLSLYCLVLSYWDSKLKDKRLVQTYLYFKEFLKDNEFAHPLNFLPVIDLTEKKILFITELPIYANFSSPKITKMKLPKKSANYNPKVLGKEFYRKDVHNLKITGGGSFKVINDYDVYWQKFKTRVGFNLREGLVLYDVWYKFQNKWRSILYRATVAELYVPYGDPRFPFDKKGAFDFADGSGGYLALNPQRKGLDCLPENSHLIDVYLNDEKGQPELINNGICIYENDGGILHKHVDDLGRVTISRSNELVIQVGVTSANYDYVLKWILGQDAHIRFEAHMTGLLSTNLIHESVDKVDWGTIVSPQVLAQFHQHIFCARLDTMIDGTKNTVSTVDIVQIINPKENPYGIGFTTKESIIQTESESSYVSSGTDRFWKISNPNNIHPITQKPVCWKLAPMNKRLLLAKKGSDAYIIGNFATNSLRVTKFHDGELHPVGNFVNRHKPESGLVLYAKNNESVVNTDIVIWHSFGLTHIPRIEDYPIMANEMTGFTFKPCGFFTTYPGLDVPPPPAPT